VGHALLGLYVHLQLFIFVINEFMYAAPTCFSSKLSLSNVLVHKTGTTSSFQIQHRGECQHAAFVM